MSKIREIVRDRYGKIAASGGGCCGPADSGCCVPVDRIGEIIGYDARELSTVPDGANLGLGCGNPVAFSAIKPGDTVLDLGSGAGLDCFLASRRVTETGKVIGVDMTQEMIERARANAERGRYSNVEFRQGFIEELPVDDNSIDLIISNCVINLSPDKEAVFREMYRVLKPGGRVYISDIVLLRRLPLLIRKSVMMYVGCVAGALRKDSYLETATRAGLDRLEIISEKAYGVDTLEADHSLGPLLRLIRFLPGARKAAGSVVSILLTAEKPHSELDPVGDEQ